MMAHNVEQGPTPVICQFLAQAGRGPHPGMQKVRTLFEDPAALLMRSRRLSTMKLRDLHVAPPPMSLPVGTGRLKQVLEQ